MSGEPPPPSHAQTPQFVLIAEPSSLKFVPGNLDRSCVSKWIKVTDAEGFGATVQIHRLEGLLVGGSSGAIVAGVLKYLKSDEGWKEFGGVEEKNVVALLPDGCVSL